ncbi:MAG: hypothetical protein WDN06_14695 [Asticcacaulis sp.]
MPKSAGKDDDDQEPASAPNVADDSASDAADTASDSSSSSAALARAKPVALSQPLRPGTPRSTKLVAVTAPVMLPGNDPTAGHHFFAPAEAGKGN